MRPSSIHVVLSGGAALLSLSFSASGSLSEGEREGLLSRVVGPQECAECHEREFAVWKDSHHEAGSRMLTREPLTREIARALGIRRVMTDDRCTRCHYTVQMEAGEAKASAGVSCESCHGPGRDWLDEHDDFGGPDVDVHTEAREHRRERLARCEELGMHHPDRLTDMVRQCVDCHTITEAELLLAGHPSGAGFEFVAWSQGEVRHNFVRGEGQNVPSAPERRRVMYVVGRLLELARVLEAEGPDGLADPVLSNAVEALVAVRGIAEALDVPTLAALVAEAQAGDCLTLPREDRTALAARLVDEARRFEEAHDGTALVGVDALLPAPSTYVGAPPE